MKKFIAFLMACTLCLSACCALGETDVLTVDEMVAYCDVLLSEAQAAQPVAAQASETGGYVHDMGAFSVYTQEPSLFSQLLGVARGFVTITPDSPRAMTAEDLAQYLRSLGAQATPCASTAQGIDTVLSLAGTDDVVCICGSLYMIGEVRHLLGLC